MNLVVKNKIDNLVSSISRIKINKNINIMEVCGTHTMAISKNGIRQLLPENINLISGPGCPVCVSSVSDIDWILEIIEKNDVTLFTFGDMLKVPGSYTSLYGKKSNGKDIRICYSPLDALEFAKNNPDRKVIFIAIGFETTIPLTAVTVKRAYGENVNNFYIFCIQKIIPPALNALLEDKEVKIGGLLCPGHVSAIIGSRPYNFIVEKYRIPCVISGFEPLDILKSINMLLKQINDNKPKVEIQYTRAVKEQGNKIAVNNIYNVFEREDTNWRGIGIIPDSGLKLKDKFIKFDAKKIFKIKIPPSREPEGCQCGNILKGTKKPTDCNFFIKVCNPSSPVGPCMVSSEGTCAAYYRYERFNKKIKS